MERVEIYLTISLFVETGANRSKAEILLESRLLATFPQLDLSFNDRTILKGLELDVYIQKLKLAIEWNGIFHYKDIKGNVLEKIQIKDKFKVEKCKELGIELIVIEDLTSNPKFIDIQIEKIIGVISSGIENSLQKNCE